MVEWKYINDIIVSLKTGLNPRQNFRLNTPESIFPYITGKDIFNNKINVTSVTDKVDLKAVDLINKRACLEDNLLLFASTGTGTVGRMAIVDKYGSDWAISETLYAIKTTKDISPLFLMYCLYSDIAKKQFEPKISKGSVPHLKIADLLKVKIPVPSLFEQNRIVGILDTFTASIENLKEQITQRRKQFEHYRDQLLDLEGKEGVEMKTISEVAKSYTGLTYKPENVCDTGTLVLRSSNIDEDVLVLEDNVYVQMDIPERAIVREKDLLICVRNGSKRLVGKCAMITKDAEGMAFGAFMTILRSIDINSKYLFYVWQSTKVKKQYKGDEAMPIAQIIAKDFQKIIIPVPSSEEQSRIVSILDTFEASIANLEAQLSQREKQYEYYRNKLLTFD